MRPNIAAVALMAGLGCAAAPASAAAGGQADSSLGFTTTAPGSPTGLTLHAFFRRAGDPNAKPPPLRSAVVRGPRGLRFDTTTLDQCTASDEELRLLGSDACPAETKLTVGSFSAITGFGPPFDPLEGDDHVFNGRNQLIEVITTKGGSASPAFDRLTISGATLTAHPPVAPGGPPEGEAAVRSLDFRIPVRVAGGKSLIATPPACPAGGRWATSASFSFADGSSQTVASAIPCRPALQQPRLRLAVRPRRVRAGRRVRMRFRVSSAGQGCVEGARVRLGRRSVRTDRRGRGMLRARFGRRGVRRARATSPSCGSATARIRVVAGRRRAR